MLHSGTRNTKADCHGVTEDTEEDWYKIAVFSVNPVAISVLVFGSVS